jgi:hypothetical protein
MPDFYVDLPGGAWDYHPVNYPEYEKHALPGTGYDVIDWFDDSTEEYLIGAMQAPVALDTAGTVYFEAYGKALTADGNEVQLRFSYSASGKDEDSDAVYANVESGDYATNANQDFNDFIEWNETVTTLGWSADDIIRIMLSRSAIDDGTPVSGDYGITHFRIRIPTT